MLTATAALRKSVQRSSSFLRMMPLKVHNMRIPVEVGQ